MAVLSDQVFVLAVALLGGRTFTFMDVHGLRYRATSDVLALVDVDAAVAAGDAYEVAREILRIGVRDLRGNIIVDT